LKGSQNPDTRPTLQGAKKANALPTRPTGRDSPQLHFNTSAKQFPSTGNLLTSSP